MHDKYLKGIPNLKYLAAESNSIMSQILHNQRGINYVVAHSLWAAPLKNEDAALESKFSKVNLI